MGFHDRPIVDDSAEKSEESVNRTLSFFSKKNGFISHLIDGTNDYGVDISCQLIEDEGATPFKFPIQIKSRSEYEEVILDNERFKSFTFSTSRLGHLVRDPSACGLVIIYDQKDGRLFYETVIELYQRVRASHKDDSWKTQKSVTLKVPVKNLVGNEEVLKIHKRFLNYFKRRDQMMLDHNTNYDLPIAKDSYEAKSTVQILTKYGGTLFNQSRFSAICAGLDRIPKKSFEQKEICYLAAITYTEVGNVVDAGYYFQLCDRQKSEFTNEQRDMLDIQKFRLEYFLGKKSTSELRNVLNNKSFSRETEKQVLAIKANLLGLDLREFKPTEFYDEEFINSIVETLDEIEKSNHPEISNQYLLLGVAEVLNNAINGIMRDMIFNTQISEALGGGSPMNSERKSKFLQLEKLNDRSQGYWDKSLDIAFANDDVTLEAYTMYYRSLALFRKLDTLYTTKGDWKETESNSACEEVCLGAIKSYNTFNRIGMAPVAYKSILLANEISNLAKKWNGFSLDHIANHDKIRRALRSFKGSGFKQF